MLVTLIFLPATVDNTVYSVSVNNGASTGGNIPTTGLAKPLMTSANDVVYIVANKPVFISQFNKVGGYELKSEVEPT
jgi:hypothetical protein